jgi:hypothetical protein
VAIGTREQDLSNEILYTMCRRYPAHTHAGEIFAKILIIGRVYAVSLQRRKHVTDGSRGDDFFKRAIPDLLDARIDSWLLPLRVRPINVARSDSYDRRPILATHHKLMKTFYSISQMNHRSLASKYLHFHFPNSFYIYDSRAVTALKKMTPRERQPRALGECDASYTNFVQRCETLNASVKKLIGRRLSPRELDKLLLYYDA